MGPAVLLWDFGDTLVDERFMRRPPADRPGWTAAWTDVVTEVADDWHVGRIAAPDVYAALAARAGMSVDEVARHAAECCRSLVFHEAAWRVARERRLPQAMVTVNPDMFVDEIIDPYRFRDVFDTIVVSAVEGTDDKTRLCEVALERLGFDGDRGSALLIDNREDLVDAWRTSGGAGYWFRG